MTTTPTPRVIRRKGIPTAVKWVIGVVLAITIALPLMSLFGGNTPSQTNVSSSGMGWWHWLAILLLAAVAIYTATKYIKASDGKTAAKVGGWVVTGGVIFAALLLIVEPTRLFGAGQAGIEAVRSRVDAVVGTGTDTGTNRASGSTTLAVRYFDPPPVGDVNRHVAITLTGRTHRVGFHGGCVREMKIDTISHARFLARHPGSNPHLELSLLAEARGGGTDYVLRVSERMWAILEEGAPHRPTVFSFACAA